MVQKRKHVCSIFFSDICIIIRLHPINSCPFGDQLCAVGSNLFFALDLLLMHSSDVNVTALFKLSIESGFQHGSDVSCVLMTMLHAHP